QPGSRGPGGSGTDKEAGYEEKEARDGRGPSSGDGPHGLGSAYAGADVRACSCPGALSPNGDGTFPDQLSLAVTIVPIRGEAADCRVHALEERLGVKASDEQRIDNCKAPLDRRGPKARPDECDDGASTGNHK